jgi:hypothetical protein
MKMEVIEKNGIVLSDSNDVVENVWRGSSVAEAHDSPALRWGSGNLKT